MDGRRQRRKKQARQIEDYPKEKPADVRIEKDNSYSIKHFWAFKVLDRNQTGIVKILEITQPGIQRQMETLFNDPDWLEPKDYDISIIGEGDGLKRRYKVNPSPHKPLTAEEKSLVARTEINLNALFKGENPFNSAEIAPVEEEKEVKLEDVPF